MARKSGISRVAQRKAIEDAEKKAAATKQGFLPSGDGDTMAPPRIPELETLGVEYANRRDAWMDKKAPMEEAHENLLKACHEHSVESYTLEDGRIVEVVHKDERVKVRTPKNAGEET